MLRCVEHLRDRADLDQHPVLHHGDAVGDLGDDAEVVGDEEHAHAAADGLAIGSPTALDRPDQRQDLRLGRDVERRRRFVGDQQRRLECQGHRDHHPLPLATGELERVGMAQHRRLRQADECELFEHAP
jgi:hypothetical protein